MQCSVTEAQGSDTEVPCSPCTPFHTFAHLLSPSLCCFLDVHGSSDVLRPRFKQFPCHTHTLINIRYKALRMGMTYIEWLQTKNRNLGNLGA